MPIQAIDTANQFRGKVVEIVLGSVVSEVEVETALLRPAAVDLPTVALNAGKLREATGWRPALSTQDMLSALMDYWRSVEAAKAV